MVDTTKAYSGFSVNDLEAARKFYGDTLGMRVSDYHGMLKLHPSGDNEILVYSKPDHQPATFTILNFEVDDINAAVDELSRQGIQFQRYPNFEADEKGIVRIGGPGGAIAWFTDPAGNVLSVVQTD
ncbi:MAG TPA: VOC family protein [Micromonosporaceae bacterium]